MDWVRYQTPTTTAGAVDVPAVDTWVHSSFYPSFITQGEGIDLRIEMQQILYGSASRLPKGHWVVLRKYDFCSTSSNYHQPTKEGVGGPAYNYEDILLRTRRVPLSRGSDSLTALKAGMDIGDRYIYYFTYDVNPQRGWHIMELELNDHSTIPTLGNVTYSQDRYQIKRIHPYRLENGNVQYWIVNAEYDEVNY